MNLLNLSFNDWGYLDSDQNMINRCCWGNCGLLAHSIGNVLNIYSEDSMRLYPIRNWSLRTTPIIAMAWYDGRLLEKRALPYIALSLGNKIIVLDVLNLQIIAEHTNHACTFVSLKWSYNSCYVFFAGSNDGQIFKFDISKKNKSDNLIPIWNVANELGQIVSISIEPVCGNDIIAITKNGDLVIIKNINSKEPKFSKISFEICDATIIYCDYYLLYSNFVIISTSNTVFLYSIMDNSIFNFISDSDIKYIQPLTIKKHILVIYEKFIKILEIDDNKRWICKSSISFIENCSKVNGIEAFSCVFNRIYVISSSGHINIIEIFQDKLFITKRFQLMKSEPLAWDIYNGSIAFINKNGMIYITKQTVDAIPSSDDVDDYNYFKSNYLTIIPDKNNDKINNKHGNTFISKKYNEKTSNDTSFAYVFNIKSGNRIKWISSSQILCWELKSNDKVFLINLEEKTIVPLNDKKLKFPKYPITNVYVNSDQTICCIIFGNIICYFISLTNFPKCLSIFSQDVHFTFSFEKIPNKALIISENNSATQLTINGNDIELMPLQFNQGKNIVSIYPFGNGFLLGTQTGEICETLISNNYEIIIKDSHFVTNKPIKKILNCEKVFLLEDEGNKTFIYCSNKIKNFKTNVKFISFSSANTFLIHYKNKKKIIVSKISGKLERINPNLFAPPSLLSNLNWSIYIKKLTFVNLRTAKSLVLNLGLPLVYQIIMEKQEENYEPNGISIILKIAENEKKMTHILSLFYSLLNDQHNALECRLIIDKDNKDYINDILKIIFYGNLSSCSDILNILTLKLIEMNEFSTALEIFIITGNWQKALTLLIESNNFLESIYLIKFKLQMENKEIIQLIASILADKQQISGLLLIGSIWNIHFLVDYFKNRNQIGISNIFKKLSIFS